MGNNGLKMQKNRHNMTKNGGLSKKQQERNNISYPNYMYPQNEMDRWSSFNQYPYYYNPEIINQNRFNHLYYPYDYPAYSQPVSPSISSYGGYYREKPYYETPIFKDSSKYAIKGSKKQEIKGSPRNETPAQPVNYTPNYRPDSTFYHPYYYGQNYLNYYPSFYSYYGGYYQPYSQIYMNLAQSTYTASPKIKVKDFIIPLPVDEANEQESKQISTSTSFNKRKSKKIPKSNDLEESEHDS